MTKATEGFNQWANEYRNWMMREDTPENAMKHKAFLLTLPMVLKPIAMELETLGIDSSPVWEAMGDWNGTVTRAKEKQLDKVWTLVRRLESMPVTADPFELHHDRMDGAPRPKIAEAWFDGLPPLERNRLCNEYGGRPGAIKKITKDIDNLRAKRKRESVK